MSQTLSLPDQLYERLEQGAAERGLTIQSLLEFVSEIFVLPDHATERDGERVRRIERLLGKYRAGSLTDGDRMKLERLIDADYQQATARADRLIAAKQSSKRLR